MQKKAINLREKPFYLTEEQEAWVYDTLAAMSEKEKAGQLFCCMVKPGEEDAIKAVVKDCAVGGVLYRPTLTKEQLKKKFKELDEISAYPLLKAANLEEGGNGAFCNGMRFSSQMGAAAGGMECVRHQAGACGALGAEVGINWTFSPVADIDFNFRNPITNIRTYGSDAEAVKAYTKEYVRVVQEMGVAACGKHFPGDGVDFRDQHLHPTCNSLTAEEWYRSYGEVYRGMIEEGVLSIMVGHILQPAVQKEINPQLKEEELLPGSLSRELITGVLREKFGFNGLIITDATVMNGYSMAMERKQAIPLSIQAGCDMICFTMNIYEDIEYILNGLENGSLTRERLDLAVTRILALKAKVALKAPDAGRSLPLERWAKEAADQAVTLVKDVKGILPLRKESYDKIRIICLGEDGTPDGSLREMAAEGFQKEGMAVEIYDPAADSISGTKDLDSRLLTVYICCMEAKSNNTAVHIYWSGNHAMGTPRFPKEQDYIFISFGNPYHLADVPRVPACINAYSASRFTVDAVIEKIFGRSSFKGRSPVDPFCGLFDTRL